MSSILKVDTIQDQSGNNIINENADTITIGASGDTITVPTGASLTVPNGGLTGQNYPAFEAYLSANQDLTDSTTTKVQYDTEFFDTNGYYDNVTNYRFTPLVAGKYFVYVQNSNFAPTASTLVTVYNYIYKNGSSYKSSSHGMGNNYGRRASPIISAIINMNGTTDYIEGFAEIDVTSGTPRVEANPSTYFGAYRIGD
jgi:hypothetical protein